MATATEWLDSLAAAWKAERSAARARIAMERSGRQLAERVALGIALARLRIVDEASAYGDRVRVRVYSGRSLLAPSPASLAFIAIDSSPVNRRVPIFMRRRVGSLQTALITPS